MAFRIFKRLRDLLDVDTSGASSGDALVLDVDGETWVAGAGGGGGGAPTDADYLVGTANGTLSAEIVVGASPGGELGGSWASPTVDATHSGSTHAGVQSAAEATAASALATHSADTTAVHGIADTSALALTASVQPLDSDLTAIAALSTTSFGRGLLILADQAALLSAAGAAAASHAHAGEDITSGTVADARIASTIARDSEVTSAISALSSVYQPLDSDLTAIAALTTTSFGRSVLALADQAALLAAAGAAAASHAHAGEDITSGTVADARIASTIARDSEVAAAYQPLDSDLTAFAGLSIAADKLPYGNGSHTMTLADLTAAGRALIDDADASAQLSTLGVSTFIKTLLDDADAATARATLGVSSGGDFVRLDEKLLGSDTATFDFTSISGSYRHLRILISGVMTGAVGDDAASMTFNNDTASHYNWQYMGASLTSSLAGGAGSFSSPTTSMRIGEFPGANANTGEVGAGTIDILDYAGTTFFKSFVSHIYRPYASRFESANGGQWISTAAITRITITPGTGSWKTGSRATLYGLA